MKPPVAGRGRLAELPRYQPGRSSEAAMAEHGLASAIKLASNESPFGPLPGVADAVAAAAERRQPLPGPHRRGAARALRRSRRRRPATASPPDRDRSGCSNSSPSPTSITATRSSTRGRASSPTRSSPASSAAPSRPCRSGARRSTPRRSSPAISERTRVVLIANPNNPTSTALRTADLQTHRRRRPGRLPRRHRRGVPRVRHRRRRPRRRSSCSATAPTSPCCARCRRPTGWPACASASSSPTRRSSTPSTRAPSRSGSTPRRRRRPLAALDQHAEVARRCAVVTAERTPRRPGAASPGPRRAGQRGQLLVAAGGRRRGSARSRPGASRRRDATARRSVSASRSAIPRTTIASSKPSTTPSPTEPALDRRLGDGDRCQRRRRRRLARPPRRRHRPVPRPPRRRPSRAAPIRFPARTRRGTTAQVWAHVAEFGDYWLAELTALLDAPVGRAAAVRAHPPRPGAHRRHRVRPTRRAGAAPRARSSAPPTASPPCSPG